MVSPVSSITRAATRKINEPLNILTFPTHERYESMMAKCGHNFYAYRAEGITLILMLSYLKINLVNTK